MKNNLKYQGIKRKWLEITYVTLNLPGKKTFTQEEVINLLSEAVFASGKYLHTIKSERYYLKLSSFQKKVMKKMKKLRRKNLLTIYESDFSIIELRRL